MMDMIVALGFTGPCPENVDWDVDHEGEYDTWHFGKLR